MKKLDRREKFSASVVLVLSLSVLLWDLWSIIQFYQQGFPEFAPMFLLSQVKYLMLAVAGIVGSLLLFKKQNIGWIVCVALIFLAENVVLIFFLSYFGLGLLDPFLLIAGMLFFVLIFAFAFLFSSTTRNKFRVKTPDYALAGIAYIGALLVLLFF